MIIIKDEIKTSDIKSCVYNFNTKKWDVEFKNGKIYSYAYSNVEKLVEPVVVNPDKYRISRDGNVLFDIKEIYVFSNKRENFWHIFLATEVRGITVAVSCILPSHVLTRARRRMCLNI